MAHSYTVDEAHRLVRIRVFGVLTPESVSLAEAELRDDPRIRSDFSALFDCTDVTSVGAIHSGVLRGLATTPMTVFVRRAFIAPSPAVFGLCRMYGTLREMNTNAPPEAVLVFRTAQEAEEWLAFQA